MRERTRSSVGGRGSLRRERDAIPENCARWDDPPPIFSPILNLPEWCFHAALLGPQAEAGGRDRITGQQRIVPGNRSSRCSRNGDSDDRLGSLHLEDAGDRLRSRCRKNITSRSLARLARSGSSCSVSWNGEIFRSQILRLLASPRSAGRKLEFRGEDFSVEALDGKFLRGHRSRFFQRRRRNCETIRAARAAAGAVVIDNSSAFRMDAGRAARHSGDQSRRCPQRIVA